MMRMYGRSAKQHCKQLPELRSKNCHCGHSIPIKCVWLQIFQLITHFPGISLDGTKSIEPPGGRIDPIARLGYFRLRGRGLNFLPFWSPGGSGLHGCRTLRYPNHSKPIMPDSILQEITELIVADPHGGGALNLYALVSTLRMDKSGHLFILRKLRDMTPGHRQLAYRLMELMAREGNAGEAWEQALERMDEAVRKG